MNTGVWASNEREMATGPRLTGDDGLIRPNMQGQHTYELRSQLVTQGRIGRLRETAGRDLMSSKEADWVGVVQATSSN